MKPLKHQFFLVLSILILFASCKKESTGTSDNNADVPLNSDFGKEFFENNGVESQFFYEDASNWIGISGTGDTYLSFAPNSFVTVNGNPVSGEIEIELREIYTKKEMILSGMMPVSYGELLVSGGEIFVMARQNGQELKLAQNVESPVVTMSFGNPVSYNMMEFYAEKPTYENESGWELAPDSSIIEVYFDSTFASTQGYRFDLNQLGWINCDYFYEDPNPRTTVTIETTSTYNYNNSIVFISLDGENAVAQASAATSTGRWTFENWPTGSAVTFVALAEINGQYYSGFKSAVVTENHIENIQLNATSWSQFLYQLDQLP